MYPVSEAYKNAIAQNERNVRITGTITLKDESIINITDADIVLGSLYVSEQCVSGEDIEIGNVYASELGLALTSPPENPYTLDGARIIINFGINVEPDPEEDPVWEYVPLGYFYVTEIERKQTTVNLKALDGMILFDVDLSGVLTTGTPYALVSSCCTKAGVTLATSSGAFEGFANGLTAFTIPEDSKIETCRDLIMWVCQATGTFARMNRLGQLEIVPVTAGASVKTISKQERFTSDVSDFGVKITKVTMKIGEEEYSQGTAGMTLALEENPLLAGKSEAEINTALAEILDQVTEAEYTPYNLTFAGDPALQAGDWVKLTGVSNINGPEFEYSRNSLAYHPETGAEIPEDTPVFVDFAAGKKGSLMEEGTTNLANNPTFSGAVGTTPSGWHSDVTIQQDDFFGQLINVAELLCVAGNVFEDFGASIAYPLAYNTTYTISFWARGTMELTYELLTKRGIASATWKSKPPMSLQWQRYEVTIVTASSGSIYPFWWYLNNANDVNVGKWVRIARIQLEQKPYATSFIDGTRAAPLKRITLPEALPDEFGVGIAAKMLHESGAKDRTFWQAGDYRCYFDAADNKIKMTNGVVTAETAAVTWGANDYVGIYAGRENGNLFIQAKIAGVVEDKEQAGDAIDSGTNLYVGSKADGTESVNATLADFVLHDRPEDIDPEGYLTGVPGGGGE